MVAISHLARAGLKMVDAQYACKSAVISSKSGWYLDAQYAILSCRSLILTPKNMSTKAQVVKVQ